MTTIHTEAMLSKLNKTNLIDMILKMQEMQPRSNSQIASLVEEAKDMNSNFKEVEADVTVPKNVNNKLE